MSDRAKLALQKAKERTNAVQAKLPQPQAAVVATPWVKAYEFAFELVIFKGMKALEPSN